MQELETRWRAAVDAATVGMTAPGRRERERHARHFAAWCMTNDIHRCAPSAADVDRFLSTLGGRDPQLRSKVLCALRAVFCEIDQDVAARAAGLGCQSEIFTELSPAATAITERVISRLPRRAPVRRAALGRLFAWAKSVGCEPLDLVLGDLAQFRSWLVEVRAGVGDTMPVAEEFIKEALSHRSQRAGRRNPRPLRLELDLPLPEGFSLADVAPDRFGRATRPVVLEDAVGGLIQVAGGNNQCGRR